MDLLTLGVAWGGVAALLGARAFGPAIWSGVLAAPAIGVAVGSMLQTRFEAARPSARRWIALLSLYAGATVFALLIGAGTLAGWGPGRRSLPAAFVDPVISVWWGVTLTGFVLVLWPLAYLSHRWLEWRGVR